MKKLNDNKAFFTTFVSEFSIFAFGMRNKLLYRAYKYFQKHNLPISDLAEIADMSRQALYNAVSNYVKSQKREASK